MVLLHRVMIQEDLSFDLQVLLSVSLPLVLFLHDVLIIL
jgi:hypothetical protein